MPNDVYVFGDSHWRVFFPFVNHGAATDNISHVGEFDGVHVRTIDTIANELSGATMWGLLNPDSKNGARKRILNTLDGLGGVDNVALVFGEVDARYHHARYYRDGKLSSGRIMELVSRYVKFIQEDLLMTGRVTQNIFVYHGFAYPHEGNTLLQPGQPIGDAGYMDAKRVNHIVREMLSVAFMDLPAVRPILPADSYSISRFVSNDGVHLDPKMVYEKYTLPAMAQRFYDGYRTENPCSREIPL